MIILQEQTAYLSYRQFSHIRGKYMGRTIMGWMFNQIKMKMELHDPQVQSDKIKSVMRYWTGQLSAVINKTASRAILAVAANLVDKVNSTPPTASSSDQCDDIMNANHESAQRFMEDMELAVLNQDHTQI